MSHLDNIANIIRNSLMHHNTVSISFFGQWIERPYENWFIFNDIYVEDDTIIILFDTEEMLWVKAPEECLTGELSLSIRHAVAVRWEWTGSGPQNTPSRIYVEFIVENNKVLSRNNIHWAPVEYHADPEKPAVQIWFQEPRLHGILGNDRA